MKIQIAALTAALALAGCAEQPRRAESVAAASTAASQTTGPAPGALPRASKPGGYYLDDGPGANPPPNLEAIPDAVPRIEPLHKFANNAYVALGQEYTPMTSNKGYRARGLASWYGRRFHGKPTSSGEPYDMYAMSAAHPTLPIPSYARVTSLANGKSVIVRINDRGPFHSNRIMDLSYTAAHKLGIVQSGSGQVEVEAISAEQITQGRDADAQATGIYLQLGSFGNRANAEKLLAQATTRLDRSERDLVILNHADRFRVALGPYADNTSADAAAREIEARMNFKPVRIVR